MSMVLKRIGELPFPLRAAGISLFVIVVLIIFRPVTLKLETSGHLIGYLGLAGIIFGTITINHYFFFPLLNGLSFLKTRTLASKIITQGWFLGTLVLAIFLYLVWIAKIPINGTENLTLLGKIIIAGLIPWAFLTFFQRHHELKDKIYLLETSGPKNKSKGLIRLQSENGKDQIQLEVRNIFFIRAEDNYVAIIFATKKTIKEVLLRATISSLTHQLEGTGVVQCHRSYLVNISKILKIQKKGQRHFLEMRGIDETIPLSRTFAKSLRATLSENTL